MQLILIIIKIITYNIYFLIRFRRKKTIYLIDFFDSEHMNEKNLIKISYKYDKKIAFLTLLLNKKIIEVKNNLVYFKFILMLCFKNKLVIFNLDTSYFKKLLKIFNLLFKLNVKESNNFNFLFIVQYPYDFLENINDPYFIMPLNNLSKSNKNNNNVYYFKLEDLSFVSSNIYLNKKHANIDKLFKIHEFILQFNKVKFFDYFELFIIFKKNIQINNDLLILDIAKKYLINPVEYSSKNLFLIKLLNFFIIKKHIYFLNKLKLYRLWMLYFLFFAIFLFSFYSNLKLDVWMKNNFNNNLAKESMLKVNLSNNNMVVLDNILKIINLNDKLKSLKYIFFFSYYYYNYMMVKKLNINLFINYIFPYIQQDNFYTIQKESLNCENLYKNLRLFNILNNTAKFDKSSFVQSFNDYIAKKFNMRLNDKTSIFYYMLLNNKNKSFTINDNYIDYLKNCNILNLYYYEIYFMLSNEYHNNIDNKIDRIFYLKNNINSLYYSSNSFKKIVSLKNNQISRINNNISIVSNNDFNNNKFIKFLDNYKNNYKNYWIYDFWNDLHIISFNNLNESYNILNYLLKINNSPISHLFNRYCNIINNYKNPINNGMCNKKFYNKIAKNNYLNSLSLNLKEILKMSDKNFYIYNNYLNYYEFRSNPINDNNLFLLIDRAYHYSQSLPKPVAIWFLEYFSNLYSILSNNIQSSIEKYWSSNIYNKIHFNDYYPLSNNYGNINQEIAPKQLEELLRPNNKIDNFIFKYIYSLYDKKNIENADNILNAKDIFNQNIRWSTEFKSFYYIYRSLQIYYFHSYSQPEVVIYIKPLNLDAQASSFSLKVNNNELNYFHGMQSWSKFRLPLLANNYHAEFILHYFRGKNIIKAFTGSWAFLHLLDLGKWEKNPHANDWIWSYGNAHHPLELEIRYSPNSDIPLPELFHNFRIPHYLIAN